MRVRADLGLLGDSLLTGLRRAAPDIEWVTEGPAEVFVTVPRAGRDLTGVIGDEVRWVHNIGAGVDGVPLDECRTTTCSRGASAVAIAEFVLASMLAYEKRFPEIWISSPPEAWNVAGLGGLAARTLGLVGIGAIGTEVARRALAFDMHVAAVRRTQAAPLDGVELAGSLPELLAAADHVVVATPATSLTKHLFDAGAFAAMKPGAHFVNIARGSIVDQEALLDALDSGQVGLATLDAVDPEPLPAGHPFYTHPRVRLTAHVSWSSPTTGLRTFEIFVENLRRYRAGEELYGVVDPIAGY